MKPTTPQQIEATIAIVRAAAAGDPLDDSHTLRGHLAMVLGALDEARAEAERQGLRATIAAAERDEARREVAFRLDRERSIIDACERVADGGQYRADIVGAIERIRRERDEARRALRTIAAAFGCEPDDPDDLAEAARMLVTERDEARAALAKAERERDDLSRAIEDTLPEVRALREASRTEPARIAAAEMARDVAWVRAIEACGGNSARYVQYVFNVPGYYDAARVQYAANHGDDIAAAIRAARGAR